MKKLISLAVSAVLAISLIPCGAYAADENGIGTVYYQNDFSTAEKVSEMNTTAQFKDGTMKLPETSAYELNFGSSKIPDINTNKATIEINFIIKADSVSNWTGYMLNLIDGKNATGARVQLGYRTYYKDYVVAALKDRTSVWDTSLVLPNSISANENHKLCMVTDSGKYDLYLDGNKITTRQLDLNSSALTDVKAINYMNSGNYLAMHFNDFLVKETGTMALRGSSVADGAAEVAVSTEKISLTFENPLTAESGDNITVSGLTKDTDYTVEIDQVNDARTAVIVLNEGALAENTDYTVNYDVADYMGGTASGTVSFKTEEEAAPPEPVETTVSVSPQNGASDINAYSPIVFTYNKNINADTVPAELTLSNGRKANVTVSGQTITVLPVNPLSVSETITVTLPETIEDAEGAAVPLSTTTYTTMDDSVYFAHIFRDRDNPEQTIAEFPAAAYLVEGPQGSGDSFVKGNGLVENNGKLTLIYKLDQGIDSVETMEYYGTVTDRGSASYYIGNQKETLISEENKIEPAEAINDARDNGTGGQNYYTKNIFTGDGTQKYFAVEVEGKNYVPQLQYVKFNQPKPETAVSEDIPTAVGNSVTFKMNSRLDAESVSADKFKADGESVISASASGNKLTLVFSALDFQKTYTVTASGVTNIYGTELSELKFITPKAIEVISGGIEETGLIAGGTATGKARVKNNSPENQNVMAASAYYDGDKLLKTQVRRVSINAGETADIALEALDITDAGENNKVKVFVWLAETYQPVTGVFEISGTAQN